ncbi:hypothetical protein G6F65_021243 [Rhizopus arrhizus]|nr:hypothetical protein G6F65_021243 [Rhizopus arrhizus]
MARPKRIWSWAVKNVQRRDADGTVGEVVRQRAALEVQAHKQGVAQRAGIKPGFDLAVDRQLFDAVVRDRRDPVQGVAIRLIGHEGMRADQEHVLLALCETQVLPDRRGVVERVFELVADGLIGAVEAVG